MSNNTIPKRLQREHPSQLNVNDSIYNIFYKFFKKLKNSSEKSINLLKKPKPHARSLKPCDINDYINGCKNSVDPPLECDALDDFFDGISGSSSTSLPLCTLSHRLILPKENKSASNSKKQKKAKICCFPQKVSPYELSDYELHSESGRGQNWTTLSRPKSQHDGEDNVDGKLDTIEEFIRDIADNSDRVSVGLKLTRRVFGFGPGKKQNYSRAYFTVWITIMQLIIFLIMIGSYGIAPIGLAYQEQTEDILMIDTNIRSVSQQVLRNLWIGPRQDDLIHLGAKFTPCIKADIHVAQLLSTFKKIESKSGCCVYNDGSGCVQTSESQCSPLLSSWMNGTVCGEDPRYCRDQITSGSNNWGSDITNWPACFNATNSTLATDYHMKCSLVGRPCCIGVLGQCVMATREYCNFKRGFFHQEAFLCSQVSCTGEVCGMLPFRDANVPDQFYRFLTSQFIHPGILALVITQLFQWLLMYDLERLVGTFEMTVVYLYCGVCGSIMSAIFMPYYVEAGPSGSQFGVLAILTVEIIRWNVEERPRVQMLIIFVSLLILFIIGLIVPQVDNWAHLGGFVVGIFLSFAFRPFYFCKGKEILKIINISIRLICALTAVFFLTIFLIIFYIGDLTNCWSCLYFNCLPFSETYCEGMSINVSAIDVYKQIQ